MPSIWGPERALTKGDGIDSSTPVSGAGVVAVGSPGGIQTVVGADGVCKEQRLSSNSWILVSGLWDDYGIWVDSASWLDEIIEPELVHPLVGEEGTISTNLIPNDIILVDVIWILITGIWNDNGIWNDSGVWKDKESTVTTVVGEGCLSIEQLDITDCDVMPDSVLYEQAGIVDVDVITDSALQEHQGEIDTLVGVSGCTPTQDLINTWILLYGLWNDAGIWIDNKNWID